MRGVKRVQDLPGIEQSLIERQRALDRLALDALHDQVVGTHVVERADIRMIQRGDGLHFALEAFAERWWLVLMATIRFRRVSRAVHTWPMPPSPSGVRIS